MRKLFRKVDLPVEKVRRYLEPGPIVLVSSAWEGRHNIMTMGWHTVMEFSPSLVGCVISAANHSFEMVRRSRECVINLPTSANFECRLADDSLVDRYNFFIWEVVQAHAPKYPETVHYLRRGLQRAAPQLRRRQCCDLIRDWSRDRQPQAAKGTADS